MSGPEITHVERQGETFVIPADLLGPAFGLEPREVPGLMRAGRITSRTERGEGEHAGRWRLILKHAGRTVRLTVDDTGRILSRAVFDSPAGPFAVPEE
jgi:hypothetical protein